ncbi:hypothetical protein HKX48_008476 [Thoreauomyces humboldtii]|nr:hypothetical protein HKX48_008476 [Thoreauomyces humboldtii]
MSTSERHRALLMPSGHRIVVGIDFGASHSGFAFAHVSDPSRIECFYDWEDQMRPYCKNHTSVWFNVEEKKVEAWGYNAVSRALQASGEEAAKCRLLERIKQEVEPQKPSPSEMPEGVDGMEVVGSYLRELYQLLLQKLQRTFGSTLQPEDIHFCLTVPGTDGANLKLTELARGDGDWCGSMFVDNRFIHWLGRKVGEDALTQLKEERGRDYMTVLMDWERIKRQFKGPETFANVQHTALSIPAGLYNLMSDASQSALEDEQDGVSDDVYITLEDMKTFFDPVVDKILDLVQRQLDRCPTKRCNKLFAVGGFSGSLYLTQKLQERFANDFDQFVFPADPGSAVVQGAVMSGLEPQSISARCSRYTYGLELAKPLSSFPGTSNPRDIFKHEEEGREFVDLFNPIIRADQVVSIDDHYAIKTFPVYSYQTSVTVSVYATAGDYSGETSMSDVEGKFDVGFIPVDDVPTTGDRSITVYFYFGLSEFTVVAKMNGTGVEKRMSVVFATR